MTLPRIVVVGSLNMDIVLDVERAPDAGETIEGRHVAFVGGGKGANQAVAAARLGGRVTLVGRVGADVFGTQLRRGLEAEDIDIDHVGIDEQTSTGVALIQVEASAQNRITIVPGANAHLTPDHVAAAAPLLTGASALLLQLETPLATVERAIDEARRAGVPVILNPAPAGPLPEAWWRAIDVLVPNETEASLLTGIPVNDIAGAERAARALQARGVGRVLVTLGAQGVLVRDEETQRVAAPHVKAVDTTAAGDTFIGALAVALAEALPLIEAARFAVRAASLSVTRHGAQTSIPRRPEL